MSVSDSSGDEGVACASDEECLNNGSCVTAVNESTTSSLSHHYCRCQPRWTGDRCQIHLTDDLPAHYTPVQAAVAADAESDGDSSSVGCSAETCIHGVCAADQHQPSTSRCFCIPGQSVSRQHTSQLNLTRMFLNILIY